MAADQCASGPNPWRGINSLVVNAPAVKCTSSKRTARNERTEVNPCGGGQSLRWWSIPVAVVNPCGSGQSLWRWSILVAVVNPWGGGQSLWQRSILVAVVNPCGGGQSLWWWSIPRAAVNPCDVLVVNTPAVKCASGKCTAAVNALQGMNMRR